MARIKVIFMGRQCPQGGVQPVHMEPRGGRLDALGYRGDVVYRH